jgi:hypothetical protein
MQLKATHLIRHDGLQLLALAILTGWLVMSTVPEQWLRMDSHQKKEYLKTRYRRMRRKAEELLDLDSEDDECN